MSYEMILQDEDKGSSWDQQPSYHDSGPSGPLAGENVMNVVLVGAECAPWSKTGKLHQTILMLPCMSIPDSNLKCTYLAAWKKGLSWFNRGHVLYLIV